MSTLPGSLWWAFLSAGLALTIILLALAAALILNQRRFVALHRRHAEGLLKAQEEERAWVAREVHDDVLQRIAVLLQEVDKAGDIGSTARRKALRAEIQDLSVVLEGILASLGRLTADLTRSSGIQIGFEGEIEEPGGLTPEQRLVAYRVVQEALNNLIRHSGAAAGLVRAKANGGDFIVEIEDQGRGFVQDAAQTGHGLGLISMGERAHAVGGGVTIRSQPGSGTVVRLRLPAATAS